MDNIYAHMGKNMRHCLDFLRKYPNDWHSFNPRCRATTKAIKALVKRNLALTYQGNMAKAVPHPHTD